jgi:aromatic ring-opening dioxygenase catalytic subunit (LigB family)
MFAIEPGQLGSKLRVGREPARRRGATEEHLLPLLVAFGASAADDSVSMLQGGWDRALSMDSFIWDAAGATQPIHAPG